MTTKKFNDLAKKKLGGRYDKVIASANEEVKKIFKKLLDAALEKQEDLENRMAILEEKTKKFKELK